MKSNLPVLWVSCTRMFSDMAALFVDMFHTYYTVTDFGFYTSAGSFGILCFLTEVFIKLTQPRQRWWFGTAA